MSCCRLASPRPQPSPIPDLRPSLSESAKIMAAQEAWERRHGTSTGSPAAEGASSSDEPADVPVVPRSTAAHITPAERNLEQPSRNATERCGCFVERTIALRGTDEAEGAGFQGRGQRRGNSHPPLGFLRRLGSPIVTPETHGVGWLESGIRQEEMCRMQPKAPRPISSPRPDMQLPLPLPFASARRLTWLGISTHRIVAKPSGITETGPRSTGTPRAEG
ncbi:hypothetical protein S40293_11478 [Stachybotrys chartarum IBT 40293]|nr:hypothetical protein S40293_11478 [Stachybotrys chartarum IBT 40293]